jgi:hypothetical protein
MNKEQLSNGVINRAIEKDQWRTEQSAKIIKCDAHNQQVLAPFERLEARSAQVRQTFRELIEIGHTWREPHWDNHAKKGIVVVLEKAPVSPVTPDHMAVCLLEYRLFIDSVHFGPKGDFGGGDSTFNFAFIPTRSVNSVIESKGYPFAKIPETELSLSTEVLPKHNQIRGRGHRFTYALAYTKKVPSQRGYDREVKETEADVATIESSLAMVLQAIANPSLNPHLNQEPILRVLSEDDQYFVRPH